MPEPSIKAVELVRSIREAHYALIKSFTPQEKIAFFREKARALHAKLGRAEEPLHEPTPPAASPQRQR